MRNVFRVLSRDLKRIAKAPASIVVVGVLILLPSLYTWLNVVGFWNPYNNTGNLKVCVVNEDAGVQSELLGDLHLGEQIVDELHENDQLGWSFVDRDTAMAEISSGDAYAAIVIPKSFSYDMSTLVTDDFQRPQLEYYVNEKLNPVAPKITDTGASTLDNTVNDTFVETAAKVVAESFNETVRESQASFGESKSRVLVQVDGVLSDLDAASAAVADLAASSSDAAAKADAAKSSLAEAKAGIEDMATGLSDASSLAASLSTKLGVFSGSMSTALDKALGFVSAASAQTNVAVGQASGDVVAAQAQVRAACAYAQTVVDGNARVLTALEGLLADQDLPDEDKALIESALASLSTTNSNAEAQLESLEALSESVEASAESVALASDSVNEAVQASIANAEAYREDLSQKTIPQISASLASISSTMASLSGVVAEQTLLIDQTSLVLDQLSSTLTTTADALSQTDGLLASVRDEVDTVRTDIAALGTAGLLSELFGGDGSLDVEKIAEFMRSPTQLKTEQLYPLNAYGSAMSPLFMNMTLWIGVFMLMVIMHLEVDTEGVRGLTASQRFLGRGLLLALIAVLQSVVCVTGCLVLGVQAVNAPALFLTAAACSLTYLSIQYTLSTALQHVGKGLCIIMIFVQIPGATGLYPIELTNSFFQTVYPFFPFTYGIDAMREAIFGFYDGTWFKCMGMLGLFWVVFLLLGVFVRPYLANLNRMFARQLEETGIVNCEKPQLPARRYRVAQIVRAMSDHEEFRCYLEERSARFMRLYPRLKWGAYVLGVVVPVLFTAGMALWSPGKKVVVLTVWLFWLVLMVAFLVVLEYMRDGFERKAVLNSMGDDELRVLLTVRKGEDEGFEGRSGYEGWGGFEGDVREDRNGPEDDARESQGRGGFGNDARKGVFAGEAALRSRRGQPVSEDSEEGGGPKGGDAR